MTGVHQTPGVPPAPHLILAPIRGTTDCIYRQAAADHFGGFDRAIAPFIPTVLGTRVPDKTLRDVLPEHNTRMPVEPQLLSKHPDAFVRMAARLGEIGYTTVNLNLGCPFPRVAKKGRGSGMLCHPETVDRFLDTVVPAIPNRLSIKLRLGRFAPHEIEALVPVLNRYPLDALIIHPRVGVQMYDGRPDLEWFARAAAAARHPVVYNGDINAREDFTHLSGRFPGIAQWMIGRGALCNPFLPGAIKADEAYPETAYAERLRAFHDDLFAAYKDRMQGPGHLLDRMKGIWYYLAAGFADGRRLLKRIQKCRHVDCYEALVEDHFDSRPRWQPPETRPWAAGTG
jgi:tRNA-dihydrouridine synthase